jgi:hypothetical protein
VGERVEAKVPDRSAQDRSSVRIWTLDQRVFHAGEVLNAVTPTRDRTIMLSETSQTEQSCYAGRPRSKAEPLRLSWTSRHAGPPAAVLGAAQPLPPRTEAAVRDRRPDVRSSATTQRGLLPSDREDPLCSALTSGRRSRPKEPTLRWKGLHRQGKPLAPLPACARKPAPAQPRSHRGTPTRSPDGQACVCPRSIAAGMVVKVFVGAGERVAQLTGCEATCGGGHPLGGGEFTPTGDMPRHSGRPWERSQPVIHHTRPPTPHFADPVTSQARSSAACGSPRPHTADAERTPMPTPALPMPGSGRAAGGVR